MHIILVAKTTKKLSFVPRIAKELKKENCRIVLWLHDKNENIKAI